jgi:hypothetical protein
MEERHELLLGAVEAVLLPLARLCVARGLPADHVEELLKRAYVGAARERQRESGAVSGAASRTGTRDVSQVATATGLSRREVARLDAVMLPRSVQKPSPVNQIYLRWSTAKRLQDSQGRPRALPRTGKAPSFECLAQSVTRHVHPRSLLDEMLRQDLVSLSEDGLTVHLQAQRYVPGQDDAQLYGFLGANVGDHLAAAAANVIRRDHSHFEQAIFADELSLESAQALHKLAGAQWQRVLAEVVPEIEKLIADDKAAGREAKHRARIGLFTFHEPETDDEDPATRQPGPHG